MSLDSSDLRASDLRVPVTGSDYFAYATDRMMRRQGLPGNLCRLSIELDGRLDAPRLARAVESLPLARDLARLRMKRPMPGFSPRWCADPRPGPSTLSESSPTVESPGRFSGNGGRTVFEVGRAPLFRMELQHLGDRDRLTLDWHHCLMDADGALALIRCVRDAYNGRPPSDEFRLIRPDQRLESLGARLKAFPGRLRYCRPAVRFVSDVSHAPFATLAAKTLASRRPGTHFDLLRFNAEETNQVDRRLAAMNATFFASLYLLACSIRSLAPTLRERLGRDEAFVVPTPHSLRARDSQTPLLSNHLSFLFFRIESHLLHHTDRIYAELLSQFRDQIARHMHLTFRTAMDLFRPLPGPVFGYNIQRPTRGRMATFYYSFVTDTPEDDDTWGDCAVLDVAHLPSVGSPPGLALVHYRHHGQLRVVVAWVDNALNASEVDAFSGRLRSILLGDIE